MYTYYHLSDSQTLTPTPIKEQTVRDMDYPHFKKYDKNEQPSLPIGEEVKGDANFTDTVKNWANKFGNGKDEGMGEYNELWMKVIERVEKDNCNGLVAYSETLQFLQDNFNISAKIH